MTTLVLSNLPRGINNFINREREIGTIAELLRPSARRHLIAICGLGGVGKTALAMVVAEQSIERGEFDAYIWMTAKTAELRDKEIRKITHTLANLNDLLNTVAKVFKLNVSDMHFREKQNIVLDRLRTDKGALLIVDNLESIDDRSAAEILMFVRDLLPPPSKVITTSRRLMREEGEVMVPLDGLSMGQSIDLIQSELGLKRFFGSLTRTHMAEIFNITGGVPLAIKFVVAQLGIRGKNLQKVLNGIRHAQANSLPLLEHCFRESYAELSDNGRHLLMSMSLIKQFPVRFERLSSLGGLSENQTEMALQELTLLSLVDSERASIYRMHPLTATFALAELTKKPQLKAEIETRL
jgi:AAA ATPase domain